MLDVMGIPKAAIVPRLLDRVPLRNGKARLGFKCKTANGMISVQWVIAPWVVFAMIETCERLAKMWQANTNS